MSKNTGKNIEPKGFAGLESLVSDIEQDLVRAQRVAAQSKSSSSGATQSEPVSRKESPSPEKHAARPVSGSTAAPSKQGSNKGWFWVLGAVIFVLWIVNNQQNPNSANPQPSQTERSASVSPPPSRAVAPRPAQPPRYTKPLRAPNGHIWPGIAAYMPGYPKLHLDGLSSVTVDNSRNDSDVFVKLVYLAGGESYAVRVFYIPAFRSFTLGNVRSGAYDVRYRDLDSGALSRSEPFELEETQTYDGTRYSDMTLTLYKVANGNMQTYGLSESEF